jgi:ethanolamine ammonia-lyase small subunit
MTGEPGDAPSEIMPRPVADDEFWTALRRLTAARIGLKRSGASLATGPLLDFQLAHARARDAVLEPLDEVRLLSELAGLGGPVVAVSSVAEDRHHYLMRPDLGRRLAPDAEAVLTPHRGDYDVVFVVADGLSARAVALHARPILDRAMTALRADGWRIAPVVVVRFGRVAIGDAIAAALGAACVTVLIGERPGLSAPDSMGAYLTWQPHARTSDADRNCISNIRPEGNDYDTAGLRLTHMLCAMRARRMSGVRLKDDSDRLLIGR